MFGVCDFGVVGLLVVDCSRSWITGLSYGYSHLLSQVEVDISDTDDPCARVYSHSPLDVADIVTPTRESGGCPDLGKSPNCQCRPVHN